MKLSLPDSRLGRVAIAVVAGGGLALGVAGLAQADPSPNPSGSSSPSGQAPAEREHKPHLSGTVKSIDGGRILIVDRDGFTRQINIATVPSDVKVGVRVHAEGAVNADGVSLDATSVTLAPDRPEGKRGPGGPGGHGGRGGPGEGPGKQGRPGPAESGAPAAPSESGAPAPSATS